MNREFLFNLLLLVLVNILIKPLFIFGVDLGVQNSAAPGAYGLYFVLLNWTYLFQIVSDFGLQNFNNRYISQHPFLLQKYFPFLWRVKLVCSFFFLIVSLGSAYLFAGYSGFSLQLLLILSCNMVLTQLILFLRSNLSGLGFYRLDSLLSALDKLMMLLICGGALLAYTPSEGHWFPIEWFALLQFISLLCTFGVVYYLFWKKTGLIVQVRRIRQPLKRSVLLFFIRKSLPYAWVVLLMGLYTRFDSILLERLLPDGAIQADVFAGAYRLLDATNMLGFLFASLLLPMFARQLGRKESPRALLSFSFKLMWAGSFGLCIAVFLARFDLSALMFEGKPDVTNRADVLGILIWGFLAMSMTYIFSTLLTADERLRQMNRFFVVAVVIDLALNLLLVKVLQAQGSAISVVATQGFVALGMIYLCIRIYGFVPGWKTVVQVAVFTLLLTILAGWCYTSLNQIWEVRFALVLLLALVIALLTGLVDWRTIRTLYQKEGA